MTDVDQWYESYSNFIDNEIATMKAEPLELESWFRYTIKMQLGILN